MKGFLRRRVAALTVGLLALTGLSACSPAVKGITGLTVDASGKPLVALAWCAKRPPGFVLLDSTRPEGSTPRSSTDPNLPRWEWQWKIPAESTSPATMPLVGFPPPEADGQDVTFRMRAMSGLEQGTVLVAEWESSTEVQRRLSLDEFAQRGAEEC